MLQNRTSHEEYGLWVGLCLLILDKMEWSEQSECVLNTGSTKTNHKTVFLKGSGDLQSSSYWLGQLGCFLPSQCWFVPVGITEAKNSTLGEKEHNVLWLLHRVSQLNVTRIVGLQTVNCLDFVSRLAAGMYVHFRFWAQS